MREDDELLLLEGVAWTQAAFSRATSSGLPAGDDVALAETAPSHDAASLLEALVWPLACRSIGVVDCHADDDVAARMATRAAKPVA